MNAHKQDFQSQGFTIARGFFSEAEMAALMAEIKACDSPQDEDILTAGTLKFHSKLFERSADIQAFLAQPKIIEFLAPIIGPDIWIRWDQAVAKGPGSVTFPWHQDNAYTCIKDIHFQFWIALTEMNRDNGGLWIVPGSHRKLLPHRRDENHHMVYEGTPQAPVFIEAKAGDVVLFSSLTLHSTTPNTTQGTRWAYVVEYMSHDALDPDLGPPYFSVARQGQPQPEFVQSYRGQNRPINWIRHWTSRRAIGKLLTTD